MKKVLMLAFSNIRKNKSQAVSLLLVVFLAGFLLNAGLLLLLNFSKLFDEKSEELYAPHAAFLEAPNPYVEEELDYLRNYPGVTATESHELLAANADIKFNGDVMPGLFMMVKVSEQQRMNPLKLIGESLPLNESSIYLPYIMKTGGQINLGDDFYVTVQGNEYHYKVAGFTEEAYFGSSTIQWYRFYLSDDGYDNFKELLPSTVSVLHTVRLEDPNLSNTLIKDYTNRFYYEKSGNNNIFNNNISYEAVKNSRTFLSNITSMILVALAAVILLVSLIVIRFRIHSSIEESIVNIGVLKAMGYLSRQIILSMILQFGGISAVGVLLGVSTSYSILPAISDLLEPQTAFVWKQGFDLTASGITVLIIVCAVLFDTTLTSLRIRKMHPLTALRGGISTHNFKRNPLPLDRSLGKLTFLLAVKNIYHNLKQMIMVAAVITGITFAAASVISIYFNVGLHPGSFAGLIAGEVPDATFVMKNPEDSANVLSDLKNSDKVRKAIFYSSRSVLIDGNNAQNYISEDFSLTEGKMLYKGRYPKHDNEIALSGASSLQSGKTIGDKVSVTYNGQKREYLVTGLIQSLNDNGYGMAMTTKGMEQLYPEFVPDRIYVYLKNAEDTAKLIDEFKEKDGALFLNTLDMGKLIEVQLGVYGSVLASISVAITIITFLVVVLVLYLVLKTSILRRRQEFGIQKAVGFTSVQLMNQIALSFTPAIISGVVLGCILGNLGFNSLFVALVQSMGIMTASMPPSYLFTTLLGIGIIIFSYFISLLIALRIRKISPYVLVTE
jgi:putative ABC transport system permease protein